MANIDDALDPIYEAGLAAHIAITRMANLLSAYDPDTPLMEDVDSIRSDIAVLIEFVRIEGTRAVMFGSRS